MSYYIVDNDILKKGDDIIDWAYKVGKIEEFWINELQELLNYGGKEIRIVTDKNKKIKGTLTNIHMEYIELNNSIRVLLDDIRSICVIENNVKNDNEKKDN